MPRSRTTKTIAKRIDLGYFTRPHALRTARFRAALAAALLAAVWIGAATLRPGARPPLLDHVHNPGPLTAPHAMWQHECTQCHAGDGGRFSRAVADAACLRCHDAAIHHPNQVQFVARDESHPAGQRSASCAACHVEHRGIDLLAGRHDAYCTQCHADLASATKAETPAVDPHIGGFALTNHPRFGRALGGGDGWSDPTRLKYNHRRHNELPELRDNCVACHSAGEPPAGGAAGVPPYAGAKDRPQAALASSDWRHMQPIAYARHCAACHELRLPGGIALAHEEMAVVRSQLADVEGLLARRLASMPQAERAAALTIELEEGRGPRRRKTQQTLDADAWIARQREALARAVLREGSADAGFEALRAALPAPATQPSDAAPLHPALLEHYVGFVPKLWSCAYCHDMAGSAADATLRNEPTGIPATPRRWFASAQFDHAAHRNLSCRACHEPAWRSVETAEALLPDIDSRYAGAAACVDCHHPDRGAARGAPSQCVACHLYHDPARQRPPDVVSTSLPR